MLKKRKSLGMVAASAALAGALVLAPALSASAATQSWTYNCGSYDALLLRSYATQTVVHYRNGSAVASWTNTVLTWRSSYLNPSGTTASIYASLSIASSSAACVLYA